MSVEREYQTRDCAPVRPQFGAVLAAQRVVDGVINNVDFRPAILVIGSSLQALKDDEDYEQPTPLPTPSGAITVQVAGLMESGARYLRRFQVPCQRSFRIDIQFFQSLRLDILGSTLINGVFLYCITERKTAVQDEDVAWFGEQYAAAGRYLVPPGADQAYPGNPDAGFTWEESTVAATFNLPDPLVPGAAVEVKAGSFVTTVANVRISWRIRL